MDRGNNESRSGKVRSGRTGPFLFEFAFRAGGDFYIVPFLYPEKGVRAGKNIAADEDEFEARDSFGDFGDNSSHTPAVQRSYLVGWIIGSSGSVFDRAIFPFKIKNEI
jgi:hypothetical protein